MSEEIEEIVDSVSEQGREMWPRYFMRMSYDGSKYHGWQVQPNGITVQAVIEESLRKLLHQEKVITVGCGRTDAGVHARDFYLHFNSQKEIADIPELMFRLNHMLPYDLAIHSVFPVHSKAHARFDAYERSYEYHVHRFRNPFIHAYSNYYPWDLDIESMNAAAKLLVFSGDFASFSRTGGGQKTTLCVVKRAEWVKDGDRLVFHITANRFLRNMVRAVVGTLFKVGRGKMSVEEFADVIAGKQRSLAGDSARGCGLHLTEIKYPSFVDPKTGTEMFCSQLLK